MRTRRYQAEERRRRDGSRVEVRERVVEERPAGFWSGALRAVMETATSFAGTYVRRRADLAEIKAAKTYVRAVRTTRDMFSLMLKAAITAMVVFTGFLLLHVVAFLWVPWDLETRLAVLLGLAIVYLIPGYIILRVLMSSRFWMHVSQADRLVEKALEDAEESSISECGE